MLSDGARTTVHAASYDRGAYTVGAVILDHPQPLVRWCEQHDVRHAIVGGFFLRPDFQPLGEVWIAGQRHDTVAFDDPWDALRGCVEIHEGLIRVARRDEIPARPAGDLLQAGPLLVKGGQRAIEEGDDSEGFSAGAHQFDSDITDGRYPRAALALTEHKVLAVACDGRNRRDAGMTLTELADTLVELGAIDAINLDGGGSASLVHDGRLRNRPREEHGVDLIEGRRVVSALTFRDI